MAPGLAAGGCSSVECGGAEASTREARRQLILETCERFQAALGLQADSVRNQCEHVEALWESFLSRHSGDAAGALADLCDQLLRTQRDWCARVWRPLWGGEAGAEARGLPDVCLFLLLWGELGNLRFCPELACFLFSAARAFCAEQPSAHQQGGAFLAEVVKPIFAVVVSETFEPGDPPNFKFGTTAAPAKACNYDDWNEIFWDPKRLAGALRLRSGQALLSGCRGPADLWAKLRDVDWPASLQGQKSHHELHSALPLLVGCNRVFLLHSLTFGALLLRTMDSQWVSWGWRSSLGLVAPAWVTVYELGYQVLTPAMAWQSRFKGFARLIFPYWLPALSFGCVELKLHGFWFFPILEISGHKVDPDACILPLHFVLSVIVFLLAFAPQSSNRCRWSFYPKIAPRAALAAVAFWLLVLLLKLLFDAMVIAYCSDAVGGVLSRHRQETQEGSWLIVPHLAVILLPAATCCFASMPFFTQFAVALVGAASGIRRLGGLKLFWFRHGMGLTDMPERVCSRVLQLPQERSGESVDGPSASAARGACGRAGAEANWWARLSDRELQAFVATWNAMLHELRGKDLLSDQEEQGLAFRSVEAARQGPPHVPRLLDPTSAFHFSNALPANAEARRRIVMLALSLQMEPLPSGSVRSMPALTVLVPHYKETVLYGPQDLLPGGEPTELLGILVQYYRDEFENFRQRVWRCQPAAGSSSDARSGLQQRDLQAALCKWASLRMQTLWRTAEGVCGAYERALSALLRQQEPVLPQALGNELVLDKLQVVVAVQRYAAFSDPCHLDYDVRQLAAVEAMMATFGRCLCVAYVEEEEAPEGRRYFSCLVDSSCPRVPELGGRRKPKFRIELPGYPLLGHGKSDNQNCALVFSRGEVLQMIDANQEAYFESSLFLPLALQEFSVQRDGRRPGILGFREHVFSNMGLIGKVAADLEFAFGTMIQRTMDWPLEARLHYGHPDMMDKLQMLQQGGVSKATRGLNLSEDVFAGLDLTLRGGWTAYREYFHVGKGRDMGFMSVMSFYAKISMGNGEQAITRQWMRLGLGLPFQRLLGVFYTHVGFFLNQYLVNAAMKALAFMVAFCTLAETTVKRGYAGPAVQMASQYFTVFYLLFVLATMLPLLFEVHIELGLRASLRSLASSLLRLNPVFAAFQSKLMGHYFMSTLYYGGAQYVGTTRGLATRRETFALLFRCFSASHMQDGFEAALFLGFSIGVYYSNTFYVCMAVSIISWTVAPFLFNPRQFDGPSLVIQDLHEWWRWLLQGQGDEEQSWAAWSVRLQEGKRSASERWVAPPSGRFFAALCTTALVLEAGLVQPFEPTMQWLQSLLVLLPPLAHLLLCLLLAPAKLCGARLPPANSYAIMALAAALLTISEASLMEWNKSYLDRGYACVLFHKYVCMRFMMEVADWLSIRRPSGQLASAMLEACRLWVFSWRLLRDVVLGLVLLAFCLCMSALPGVSRFHDCFLFRTCSRGEARERLLAEQAASFRSFERQDSPMQSGELAEFIKASFHSGAAAGLGAGSSDPAAAR